MSMQMDVKPMVLLQVSFLLKSVRMLVGVAVAHVLSLFVAVVMPVEKVEDYERAEARTAARHGRGRDPDLPAELRRIRQHNGEEVDAHLGGRAERALD